MCVPRPVSRAARRPASAQIAAYMPTVLCVWLPHPGNGRVAAVPVTLAEPQSALAMRSFTCQAWGAPWPKGVTETRTSAGFAASVPGAAGSPAGSNPR